MNERSVFSFLLFRFFRTRIVQKVVSLITDYRHAMIIYHTSVKRPGDSFTKHLKPKIFVSGVGLYMYLVRSKSSLFHSRLLNHFYVNVDAQHRRLD